MSQAPLLLTSAVDCGKQEAVLVWDPIAGNQVASFSGAAAAPGTLTATNDAIFSAVSRKPILQSWSLQSVSNTRLLIDAPNFRAPPSSASQQRELLMLSPSPMTGSLCIWPSKRISMYTKYAFCMSALFFVF